MHTFLSLLLLAAGPALTWAIDIGDCQMPQCPDGWSASACNGGTPDFCCPGASYITQDTASCCIGGDVFSHTCAGGTLVPVGDDAAAYTRSVYAALSGAGTATAPPPSAGSAKTTAPPRPVTTTDASGNTVTSTKAQATSETKDAAAAGVTGLSGAAVGIALGVAMVARNI